MVDLYLHLAVGSLTRLLEFATTYFLYILTEATKLQQQQNIYLYMYF